jgi:HSP20 family protein
VKEAAMNDKTTEMQKKNETNPAQRETRAVIRPRVDVFENDAEYLVVADLPGVAKDALDLRFEDSQLRIRGGEYERAFAMPDGIDAEKIGADLSAGVLRVRLPKAAEKRSRRIDVRAG